MWLACQPALAAAPGAASADLHNLVFQRDYRIVPAIMNGWVLGSPHERRSGIGIVRGTTTAPAPIPGPDQIGLPPAKCSSLAESPRSGIAYIVAVKSECNFMAKESPGGSRIPAGRR